MFNTKLKTSIVNIQKFIFLVVVVIYNFFCTFLYVLNIIAVDIFMYISIVRKFESVSYCDLTNEHVNFEYYKYLLLKIYNQ